MKRIMVIGCPGSGKSTFSRKLHKLTGIPLYHLDLMYWNPDRTIVDKSVFRERLVNAIQIKIFTFLRSERKQMNFWIVCNNNFRFVATFRRGGGAPPYGCPSTVDRPLWAESHPAVGRCWTSLVLQKLQFYVAYKRKLWYNTGVGRANTYTAAYFCSVTTHKCISIR